MDGPDDAHDTGERDTGASPGGEPGGDFRDAGRSLVYLAAERTLLTWIRTAIGFVILGFAVDRFGLLLARSAPEHWIQPPGSSWVGIALIASGVAASIASAIRYQRFAARYARGDVGPGHGLPLAIGLAGILAIVGSGLAYFLWLGAR